MAVNVEEGMVETDYRGLLIEVRMAEITSGVSDVTACFQSET
jgi:hypothetical protein